MSEISFSSLGIDSNQQKDFCLGFDRWSFPFRHNLHEAQEFGLESLKKLAGRMAGKVGRWYLEEGDTTPQKGWSGGSSSLSLEDTIERIEERNSLVMLKRVHEDPEYAPILKQIEGCLREACGLNMASRYRDGLMTILITSPNRVTPYHIDGEANLLMQMSGNKTVYVFDGNDREILPSSELEGFWSGDLTAVRYKPELQDKARI